MKTGCLSSNEIPFTQNSGHPQIEQEFEVVGVTKHHNVYRIQLNSPNLILSAIYRHPQLTDTRVRRLMTCMSKSIPILAKVEVKTIDKSQVTGRLLRFQPQTDEND